MTNPVCISLLHILVFLNFVGNAQAKAKQRLHLKASVARRLTSCVAQGTSARENKSEDLERE